MRSTPASKVRSTTTASSLETVLSPIIYLLLTELIDIVLHSVKACLPDMAVLICPPGNFLQRRYVDVAGAILRFLPLGDQTCTLQNLDVLGNGGQTHMKWFCEFVHGRFPLR